MKKTFLYLAEEKPGLLEATLSGRREGINKGANSKVFRVLLDENQKVILKMVGIHDGGLARLVAENIQPYTTRLEQVVGSRVSHPTGVGLLESPDGPHRYTLIISDVDRGPLDWEDSLLDLIRQANQSDSLAAAGDITRLGVVLPLTYILGFADHFRSREADIGFDPKLSNWVGRGGYYIDPFPPRMLIAGSQLVEIDRPPKESAAYACAKWRAYETQGLIWVMLCSAGKVAPELWKGFLEVTFDTLASNGHADLADYLESSLAWEFAYAEKSHRLRIVKELSRPERPPHPSDMYTWRALAICLFGEKKGKRNHLNRAFSVTRYPRDERIIRSGIGSYLTYLLETP